MKAKYISEILKADKSIYKHGFCVDEIFVQTILGRFYSKSKVSSASNARYIKWGEDKSHPHTFTLSDIDELNAIVNTKYAFCRKVTDPKVMENLNI